MDLEIVIQTNMTERQVWDILRVLHVELVGGPGSKLNLDKWALARVGEKCLQLLYEDFKKKSMGYAGADGRGWKPITDYTKYSRAKKMIRRRVINHIKRKIRERMGEKYYRQSGPSLRRSFVVAELEKISAHSMLILKETGRLQNSFFPGRVSGSNYTKPHVLQNEKDQIFELENGVVTVGSDVQYDKEKGVQHSSDSHHLGIGLTTDFKRPMVQRLLVPLVLPQPWVQEILEAFTIGFIEGLTNALGGASSF